MSNPADSIQTNSPGIGRIDSAIDNHRARNAIGKIPDRFQFSGQVTDDQVKDDSGNLITGKYKIKVDGFSDDLDGYITRPDDTFKKNDVVVVNVDEDQNAWIISPALPRAHGLYLCLMIIDEKDPGTWGVSYPRMLSNSSFGLL